VWALVDLFKAVKGPIVVTARRTSRNTAIAAGLGAVVLAAASVYAVTSDEPTGPSPDPAGDGARANGGRTAQPESAVEGDAGRGLPLINGTRSGPAAQRLDARGADEASSPGSSGGETPAGAAVMPGAATVDGSEPMTPPAPTTGEPPTTATTSATAPTTTTTTLPLGGIGDLIGGLLAVLTLG
jgi:hypothetical protein